MVSTHWRNISQIWAFPQIGVNIKKHFWNHHLAMLVYHLPQKLSIYVGQYTRTIPYIEHLGIWILQEKPTWTTPSWLDSHPCIELPDTINCKGTGAVGVPVLFFWWLFAGLIFDDLVQRNPYEIHRLTNNGQFRPTWKYSYGDLKGVL